MSFYKIRFIIILVLILSLVIINLIQKSKENFTNSQGMELVLPENSSYLEHNKLSKVIQKDKKKYPKEVIWHCYWNGNLNKKHLISIRSCYYFNVRGYQNRKIILWLEKNTPNEFNNKIKKYADVQQFNYDEQIKNTICDKKKFYLNKNYLPYYADFIRTLLLLKYGGIWFDLDILFLRNMDCILNKYEKKICVVAWEKQKFPNNAFYMCLQKNNPDMIHNIKFIMNSNKGWGFHEASLTFDKDLRMTVLPCSWFDPAWIGNSLQISFDNFFSNNNKKWNFTNFYPDSFAFHWHNRWKVDIHKNSICRQLDNIIKHKLKKLN